VVSALPRSLALFETRRYILAHLHLATLH